MQLSLERSSPLILNFDKIRPSESVDLSGNSPMRLLVPEGLILFKTHDPLLRFAQFPYPLNSVRIRIQCHQSKIRHQVSRNGQYAAPRMHPDLPAISSPFSTGS